jgi:hypothetical protein
MTGTSIERDLALLDCVKRGDTEAVEVLLTAGADPHTIDLVDGLSALDHARRRNHQQIAALLLRRGARSGEAAPEEPAPNPEDPAPVVEKPAVVVPSGTSGLHLLYLVSGYVRRPVLEQRANKELDALWEVRFLAPGKRRLAEVRKALERAGFRCEPPRRIGGVQTQVVTGREAVERLLELISETDRKAEMQRGGS